jgi:hypothetical protein
MLTLQTRLQGSTYYGQYCAAIGRPTGLGLTYAVELFQPKGEQTSPYELGIALTLVGIALLLLFAAAMAVILRRA